MADENIISRRKFLGAVAAVGAVGFSACATTGRVVADGDFDYFPVMSKLGPVMTPENAYASARLGITEAIYFSAAFVFPRLERFERLERLEHPKRF